ncbi:hypothetical protein BGW41_004003 [Actinomortierella wolfii]|nr:hypothetical protein BGW41_004003 [Actinomortierella wolfii]
MNPFSHTYGHIGDYNSTNVLRLYSLLPKNSKTPLRIPRTDGKVVVLDRAFDRDFAELYNVNVLEPNELQQYYADLTRGEILQRFRSVKELTITIGLDDTEIFEWAADEARHRQHSPSTLSSRWIPPSVPIEGLFVNFSSQGPPIDLQPLSDALYGFANTLVRLYLTTPLISSLPRMGPITRTLSCLHSLIIYSGTAIIIHPSLWKKLPCLSQLIVEFSEVDLETCGDTNLVWPVMNIPSLKRLSLRGYAARMFDPKSLYNMPKLEELSVRQLYGYYPLAWATRISELWHDTWDWPLPCLTQLELEVDAWLAGVRFEFLKKCPRLERIQISGGVNDRKPQSLKVLPELTATALTEVNADTDISDCCPSLQSFKLGGQWHIEKNQLAYLYNHMLPGIKVFYLGRGVKLVDCSDVEFVQITKKHPCCRDILVPLKRTSPFREFGFVKDRADGSIYYSFENEACYCMPEP